VGHTAPKPTYRVLLRSLPWHIVLPLAAYLFVVLAGVTQSSIGVDVLRDNPLNPHGVMLGEARSVRSDEFLTASPLAIGVTATGHEEDVNPLTASQAYLNALPNGPVTSLLFFDGTILKLGPWLPDASLFAAKFWLGTLLLLLAAPAWFRTLTGSRWIGWFAAALIFFSPGNVWWSFAQANMLGFAFAGAVALQKSVRSAHGGGWWRAGLWAVLGGAALVRTPLLYPPWAVVLVPLVLLGTVAALVGSSPRRRREIAGVAGVGVLTLVFLALIYWENRDAIAATTGTLYPGSRVFTGSTNTFQSIFGATNLGIMADSATPFINGNPSEVSAGYSVALVVALLLLARGVTWRAPGHRWAVVSMLALTGFWLFWSTVDFGTYGTHIPLINQVGSGRSAQILGQVGVILLCLLLPGAKARGQRSWSLMAAGVAASVSAYAGSLLRLQTLPGIHIRSIWIAAIVLAVVVFLITYRPRRVAGYALGGIAALALVWNVNPVLFGLGDLRGTPVAEDMLNEGRAARESGEVWVADNYGIDSLMMATGVPALSGRQMSGPDIDEWSKLDPGRKNEAIWNRGGSYIWFAWTDDKELTFANPSPDVISIAGSPCTVADRVPDLTTVISNQKLAAGCLEVVRTFDWGGTPHWVYSVDTRAGR
jgi:hypothetical protein